MTEYRIVYYDGKIVRFSYKDYAHGAKTSYMTLKVYTFIGRLIRHTPHLSVVSSVIGTSFNICLKKPAKTLLLPLLYYDQDNHHVQPF